MNLTNVLSAVSGDVIDPAIGMSVAFAVIFGTWFIALVATNAKGAILTLKSWML